MLEFASSNCRAVNAERAVLEALELAYGVPDPEVDLILINAAVGTKQRAIA